MAQVRKVSAHKGQSPRVCGCVLCGAGSRKLDSIAELSLTFWVIII